MTAESTVLTSILRPSGSPPRINSNCINNRNALPPRSTPNKKRADKNSLPIAALINKESNAKRTINNDLCQQHKQVLIGNNTDLETISTPSSVLLVNPHANVSLTRDLSDLSGSYLNGSTSAGPGGSHKVPGSVYHSDQSANSYQRPWRHAKVLSSSRLPQHPQPPTDDDFSVGNAVSRNKTAAGAAAGGPMIAVDARNGGQMAIEVIESAVDTARKHTAALASSGVDFSVTEQHRRIPLLLLLMDPGRKLYELMQMWVDTDTDSVRSIVHSMQRNLGQSWHQDYDGVFQVRNNHFSQLIHVLSAAKYDVQPYELWVAKPWSMSAKATVSYASGLLNHLKRIGILSYTKSSEQSKFKQLMVYRASNQQPANSSDDTILSLSKQAQQRVYIPGGSLKHHHACQFLSFSPPFETTGTVRVDVLSGDVGNETDAESLLSDSNCGYSLADEGEGDSDDNVSVTKAAESDSLVTSIAAGSGSTPLPPMTPKSNAFPVQNVIPDPQLEATVSRIISSTSLEESVAPNPAKAQSPSPVLSIQTNSYDIAETCEFVVAVHDDSKEVTLKQFQYQTRIKEKVVSKKSRIARVLAALSCKGRRKAVQVSEDDIYRFYDNDSNRIASERKMKGFDLTSPSSHTRLESSSSSNTKYNQGWDFGELGPTSEYDGHSIVSESAPLLLSKQTEADWVADF